MVRPSLTQTLIEALNRPVESTTELLLREFQWEERDILEALAELGSRLDAWGITCTPPIGAGALTTPRVLGPPLASDPLRLLASEVKQGEGSSIEFKESLVLDVKKFTLGKQPLEQCHSDEILLSSLKTIAAFLNTGGGTLLLGVNDDGELRDLSREFPLVCPRGKETFDQWELFLRRKVEQLFVGGRAILPSISIERVDHQEGVVARILVGSRAALSVISIEGKEALYIRSGNETLNIRLSELSHFFDMRKLFE